MSFEILFGTLEIFGMKSRANNSIHRVFLQVLIPVCHCTSSVKGTLVLADTDVLVDGFCVFNHLIKRAEFSAQAEAFVPFY